MKWEFLIAKRLYRNDSISGKTASPAVKVAIIGIALGITIMLISICVVLGFKNEIRAKVIGFNAHINVSSYNNTYNAEPAPLAYNDTLKSVLSECKYIYHIEAFANKSGILKTDSDFIGVVFKGVGKDFDWSFIKSYLVAGKLPDYSNDKMSSDIVISQNMANRMNLKVDDTVLCYFIDNTLKVRKLKIVGLYKTDFSDYDKYYLYGDIHQIQRINKWSSEQYTGLEIKLHDFEQLDVCNADLKAKLNNLFYQHKTEYPYYVTSVRESSKSFFAWLDLLDTNVWVILALMTLVSGFTLISGLLIIILEQTSFIGILKTLGATNRSIRLLFLRLSFYLVLKGVLWGNIIGLSLCAIQYFFHIIKLDPASYYLSYAPIEFNIGFILLLNIASIIVSMIVLVGPSYIISMIKPSQTIKCD